MAVGLQVMASLAIRGGEPVRRRPFPRWPFSDDEEVREVLEVLREGPWSAGSSKIRLFEEEFASFHHAGYGVSCTSGSVALFVSLKALGLGPGDEAIVPAYTFLATATAVIDTGATPVIVDIDPTTYNISPEAVSKAVTEKTRCIIPVHLAGCPADMDKILETAEKHGLRVLEDAAQAHGAEWRGRRVGSLGDMAGFSFYQSKNMAAGEGGIITTNIEELAELARSLVNVGRDVRRGWYEHVRYGWNFRMTAFQAAVLRAQLRRLPELNRKRTRSAEFLDESLRAIDGVEPLEKPPQVTAHSYHLYIVRVDVKKFGFSAKEEFVKALNAEGIPCNAGYRPLSSYWFIAEKSRVPMPLKNTEKACQYEAVWIPQYVLLGEREDLMDVVEAFAKLRKAAGS
ncbi:glutamine--scyllo-inositol transaminase [Candidatus Caldarchaeum subterraneum]|uniref:Glutamine--scyllo-inositol transaminase n=1 Tax=Caldiarchaeum subterraneum TaxID=311458 RepID=E6N679_CALS0|nr:glutamine--scyllo-inositol transaminase [Candidatus Caldarchaeum subterraneum]BAJ50700.1 glutamine--scyllo-inositol transaminase [Candidatus Caldarchaeum subterraneum]